MLLVGPVVQIADAHEANALPICPAADAGLEPGGESVAVDDDVPSTGLPRPSSDLRELEAGVEHQRCVPPGSAFDQVPAVVIADRHGREAIKLPRPVGVNAVPCGVIAEA